MAKGTNSVEESSDFLVKYKNETFDLHKFLHKHPGGVRTLASLRGCDLTKLMSQDPMHSRAAFYLMQEYKVNADSVAKQMKNNGSENYTTQNNGHPNSLRANGTHGSNQTVDEDYSNQDKATNPAPGVHPYRGNGDGRLEHLVDWNKAMLPQIPALGDKYHEWVNLPVDRDLRLFGPWYLEACTKTPWWLVPLVWIPSVCFILIHECLYNVNLRTQVLETVLKNFFAGVLIWSFLEYTLHRFVFHMDTTKVGTFWKLFHFVLHGLHHKVPSDPHRLVFPPVPAFIIISFIYQALNPFFAYSRLVLAGGISGYLIYDMIHYYLHYGNPSLSGQLSRYLYHLKRYHYQHHFVHHTKGFGISSPLWDYVFQTPIILRKLKYTLKWR